MKRASVIAAVFLLTGLAGTAHAVTYDAFSDFSATNNPNGVWTYGWKATLGGTFTVYDQPFTVPGTVAGWRSSTIQRLGAPADGINTMSAEFHPGDVNEVGGNPNMFSVFRFTAPSAGLYELSSHFADSGSGATTDVHVLDNGVPIFNGAVNDTSAPSFNTLLALNPGEQIDFAVGNGGNGFSSDTTLLTATLSTVAVAPVPEPGTLLLLGPAVLGLVRIGWRQHRAINRSSSAASSNG